MQVLMSQVVEFIMIIKPIPRQLLIHTITYEEYKGSNGWGEEFDVPMEIEQVRVEPASQVKRTETSKSKDNRHIVFVDRSHSSNFPDFKEGSRITWKGNQFELNEVVPIYDMTDIPHHYELGLK